MAWLPVRTLSPEGFNATQRRHWSLVQCLSPASHFATWQLSRRKRCAGFLNVLQAKKPHPRKAQSSCAMLTATSWWSLSFHGFEVHVTPSHWASCLICS